MMTSTDLTIVDVQPAVLELAPSPVTQENNNSPLVLNFLDTYLRHIKAVKNYMDPVSDCMGVVTGTACCCIMLFAQAEENHRPATRYDAVYAQQERRRDQQELGTSFSIGYCLGNSIVDMTAISIGGAFCFFPSVYRSQCQPLSSNDSVLGIPAEEINNTKLFDSCSCPL